MGIRTENALAGVFAWGDLDIGGELIDRNSGEFLPADQVIRDPLHIDRLDILQPDGVGGLKGYVADPFEDDAEEE